MIAPKEIGWNPNGYMAMIAAMNCFSMGGVQTFMWMTEDNGWAGYYHLGNMKRLCLETDGWLRRRIRMCIWKAW